MNVCPEWLCGGEKGARSQHKMTPGGRRSGGWGERWGGGKSIAVVRKRSENRSDGE